MCSSFVRWRFERNPEKRKKRTFPFFSRAWGEWSAKKTRRGRTAWVRETRKAFARMCEKLSHVSGKLVQSISTPTNNANNSNGAWIWRFCRHKLGAEFQNVSAYPLFSVNYEEKGPIRISESIDFLQPKRPHLPKILHFNSTWIVSSKCHDL